MSCGTLMLTQFSIHSSVMCNLWFSPSTFFFVCLYLFTLGDNETTVHSTKSEWTSEEGNGSFMKINLNVGLLVQSTAKYNLQLCFLKMTIARKSLRSNSELQHYNAGEYLPEQMPTVGHPPHNPDLSRCDLMYLY